MKLISWNVNGVRAVANKNFLEKFNTLDADVFCLQETKAQDDQVKETLSFLTDYHIYSNSAERKGYSGTAIISKTKPLKVVYDMGITEHDNEGRIICAEYNDFYVVTVYVPNSGSELARLDYRAQWDIDFCAYLKKLEETKPVIVCGDLNVAHKPIDLAHPKSNYNKTAGYTQKEIDGIDRFVEQGFVDTFRKLYPDKKEAYSWWSYRANAREKNIGWRIDYFLVSQSFSDKLTDAFILPHVDGSDHCPVGIEIK